MALIRLDKCLADRTPHSRSDVKRLLREGAVLVDGMPIRDGSFRIDPDVQTVTCRGTALRSDAHVYFIVNKPLGYVCATEDRQHPVVTALIPEAQRVRGLFPAGRLDADSTGMVLLTEDGDLAHRLLAPKRHVPKYYLLRLARPYEPDYARRAAAGLTLSDGTVCRPAELSPIEAEDRYALICLHEGRYHQVRRMMAAMGNHVEMLHRVGIGGLLLPVSIKAGGFLELFHKDVENLLNPEPFSSVYERIVNNFPSYLINEGQ